MSSIIHFLGAHPEIQELLIIADEKAETSLLYDCVECLRLKRLTFCARSQQQLMSFKGRFYTLMARKPQYLPETFSFILHLELNNYQVAFKHFAVLFFGAHAVEDLNIIYLAQPRFLIGEVEKAECSAFSVWEKFRKYVDTFYVVSTSSQSTEEVLYWEKKEVDIELSVILPVYNIGKYIEKCIQSLQGWNADYVEYLFIDDGSLDNSAELISTYASKDKRIKLIQKENGGCASARQCGLNLAKGRYIGFVDPDDYIDPSMFQKLLERAMIGSYEIAYCGYKELYEDTGNTKDVKDVLGWPYDKGTTDVHYINRLIAFRRIAIWRGIYLKDLIDRNQIHFYTNLRRFDDLPFKVETFARARSVVCIPEHLYYYRLLRPGQDVAADDERLYTHFQIFKYLDSFFRKTMNKEQIDYLQVVKIQTHQWALKKIKPVLIREYVNRAREDLMTNVTIPESMRIAKRYGSRKNRLYNFAICFDQNWMIRLLNKRD